MFDQFSGGFEFGSKTRYDLVDSAGFDANQRGKITQAQQEHLRAMSGWAALLGKEEIQSSFLLLLTIFMFMNPVIFFALFASEYSAFDRLALLFRAAFGIFIAWWVLQAVSTHLRAQKQLAQDLQNNAIRQGQGMLSSGKYGYMVHSADRELNLPGRQACGLEPGRRYRLFYLEGSGFILSAQPMESSTANQKQNSLQEILAGVHDFSPQELEANRHGESSAKQGFRLAWRVPLGITSIVFPIWLVSLSLPKFVANFSISYFWNPFLLVYLASIIFGVFQLVITFLDLFVLLIRQVEGRVQLEKQQWGRGGPVYFYRIDGMRIRVSHQAYLATPNGLHCRIYYFALTRVLVSLEVLE